MGDEAIEGSKMGTKLIFFVAIVVLALAAFIVGKNLVNTGVNNLETAVQSVNDSRFSDYNGKVVRGRQVKSCIDSFSNENVAIVVVTLEMGKKETAANISAATGKIGNQICDIRMGSVDDGASAPHARMYVSDSRQADAIGINYNAILMSATDEDSSRASSDGYGTVRDDGPSRIYMKDGVAGYEMDFCHDDLGNVAFNMSTVNLNRRGSVEYVSDSASFNANLIKNRTGEIYGVVFVQKLQR